MPSWTDSEDKRLLLTITVIGFGEGGDKWVPIAAKLDKTPDACRQRYQKIRRQLEQEFGEANAAPKEPVPKESPKRKRATKAEGAKKKGKNAQSSEEDGMGKVIKDEDDEDAFGGGE